MKENSIFSPNGWLPGGGGGGLLRISSDGDDRRIISGLQGFFWGYKNNLNFFGSAAKVQPKLLLTPYHASVS